MSFLHWFQTAPWSPACLIAFLVFAAVSLVMTMLPKPRNRRKGPWLKRFMERER